MTSKFNPVELSPYPNVTLGAPGKPKDGLFLRLSQFCSRKYVKTDACAQFYASLAKSPDNTLRQCPFGFSCYPFELAGRRVAFTGLIPFPRLGGKDESARAKEYPASKISLEDMKAAALTLDRAEKDRLKSTTDEMAKYPAALHEVRKLNRTIKQEAERVCLSQNYNHPENADTSLVSIWKAAELMTYQFEILELIANESLAELPRNTRSEVYRIFDKCVRIYQYHASRKQVRLEMYGDSDSPVVLVNDKTFPIIPTVLIENAIKFAIEGTAVKVSLKMISARKQCIITVVNTAKRTQHLPKILEKGVSGDGGGTGFGLYLANLVAKQHDSELRFDRESIGESDRFTFFLHMDTVNM